MKPPSARDHNARCDAGAGQCKAAHRLRTRPDRRATGRGLIRSGAYLRGSLIPATLVGLAVARYILQLSLLADLDA
jgi:hypothetical protein